MQQLFPRSEFRMVHEMLHMGDHRPKAHMQRLADALHRVDALIAQATLSFVDLRSGNAGPHGQFQLAQAHAHAQLIEVLSQQLPEEFPPCHHTGVVSGVWSIHHTSWLGGVWRRFLFTFVNTSPILP